MPKLVDKMLIMGETVEIITLRTFGSEKVSEEYPINYVLHDQNILFIVSNVKGNTDTIDQMQSSLVVDLDDEYSLDNAIITLLNSPQKLVSYGVNSKLKVRRQFDLDERLNETYHLLSAGSDET